MAIAHNLEIQSIDERLVTHRECEILAGRIRGYWGVENKVHYVRDVPQGEDASRIRTHQLPHLWAVARNLALNLYREHGFKNMA